MTQSEEREYLLSRSSGGRRPRRRVNWWRLGLLLAFVLAMAAGVTLGWSHPELRLPGVKPGTTAAAAPRFTVLVMGADDRPGEPGRSDTMMLASVDLAQKQVRVISIPRDSWAKIPGRGWDKINHAYAFGGDTTAERASRSRQTVEGLLGLPIDHYVVVNMQGFKRVVEVLGGVTIDVEKNLKYDDPYDTPPLHIDLKAGVQRLNGEKALEYVRFRHDAESDWGRSKRQQKMIAALAKEALQPRNLTKLPSVVAALYRAVQTDLSVTQSLQLAQLLKQGLRAENIRFDGLSGRDRWMGPDQVYYLQLDLLQSRQAVYHFLYDADPSAEYVAGAEKDARTYRQSVESYAARYPAPSPAPGSGSGPAKPTPGETNNNSGVPVAILDASGKNLAARYAAKLTGKGFQVATIVNSQSTLPSTQVILHGTASTLAKDFSALMPKARIIVDAAANAKGYVDIILGSDLAS